MPYRSLPPLSLLALCVLLSPALLSCSNVRKSAEKQHALGSPSIALEDTLPTDSRLVKGTFDNGLTYYIRKNPTPGKRAELRLAVNVGSVLEDEDQLGLAHFVEHMAFNGTRNFQKHEIVDYLESIGMRFGPDINAYTSFDQTVYMLQLPTDRKDAVDKGFQILEDWADGISFDEEEIDRERGVVIEEWRLKRGADARIRDKHLPALFRGSRYAERQAIGQKAILETFDYETLRRFYRDWYRPELMAVVAVGDFDVERVKKLIEEHFGRIPSRHEARKREAYSVPDHSGTIYGIASDSEATRSGVSLYQKLPSDRFETAGDYRRQIVASLYNALLNQRLSEVAKQEEAPFLSATSRKSQVVRTREFYILSAAVKENGILGGLEAILSEARRVQQHGFSAEELKEQKKVLLHSIEQAFAEKDKTISSELASECVYAFLNREPVPGIEYEYELHQKYIPSITIEEVNALAGRWLSDENRIVLASSPERPEVKPLSEVELAAMLSDVSTKVLEPYRVCTVCGPLMKTPPPPSPVAKEEHIAPLDVTRWTLPNGVRVVLKPTRFKNDEIRFSAFSLGGTSLVAESDLAAAETASGVVSECGIGEFSLVQLRKLLADKVVNATPYIDQLSEGLSGSASPKDLEDLFQLVHLYFTAPRKDPGAFSAQKARMESMCENRDSDPETVHRDAVTAALTQDNPRFRPWTTEKVRAMDLEKSIAIYRNRFADAGDFTFVFVGSFDLEHMKPLVETYLGSLPSDGRKESWRDIAYECPTGVVERSVRKGVEARSINSVVFTGPFEWNRANRYLLTSMLDVLRIRLRERIREHLGGTYGVGVQSNLSHYPRERYEITVSFGCAPDRVDELTTELFKEIERFKSEGPGTEEMSKVKEIQVREYETNLRENSFWLNTLRFYYFHDEDPENILRYTSLVENLEAGDIQAAARRYLNEQNYVKVVLFPEESKP